VFRTTLGALLLAAVFASGGVNAAAGVVVIGHPSLTRLDTSTVQKVFTGKIIEVSGIAVTAVNANVGSPVRNKFLQGILNQDEEKYTAYWTVRRYIGKGAPPRELPSSADVINFVRSTPGAIGYIDEADIRPGLNVLLK
jgi:ABC-type phosphate transport system substrate-binding protein